MRTGNLRCILLGLATAVTASISACAIDADDCTWDGDASPGIQGTLTKMAVDHSPTPAAGERVWIPVHLRGIHGRGLCSKSISWTPGVNSGTVDSTSTSTDAAGEAGTTWTLGPTPGTQTVTASVDAADPPLSVTFTVTVAAGSHPRAQISAYNGTLTDGMTVTMQTPFDGEKTFGPLAANTMESDSLHVEVGVAFQITAQVGTLSGSITCTTLPSIIPDPSDPENTGWAMVVIGEGPSLSCNGGWAAAAPSGPSSRRAGGP